MTTPNLRISTTYTTIINFDDGADNNLLQVLPFLRTKNKKCHRRQACKLKRLFEELKAERKDHLEKLCLKTLVSTIVLTSLQDTIDQKPVSKRRYYGETSLCHFVEYIKIESLI